MRLPCRRPQRQQRTRARGLQWGHGWCLCRRCTSQQRGPHSPRLRLTTPHCQPRLQHPLQPTHSSAPVESPPPNNSLSQLHRCLPHARPPLPALQGYPHCCSPLASPPGPSLSSAASAAALPVETTATQPFRSLLLPFLLLPPVPFPRTDYSPWQAQSGVGGRTLLLGRCPCCSCWKQPRELGGGVQARAALRG